MLKRKSIMYFLYVFLMGAACFLLAIEGAEAATYNFYFNNTEQGNNSTASPSVTIKDGEKMKTMGIPETQPAATSPEPTSPTMPPAQPPTVIPSAPASVAEEPRQEYAKWRFVLGSMTGNIKGEYDYDYAKGRQDEKRSHLYGQVTHFPIKEVGLSLLGGRMIGPEVEIIPLGTKIGFGKFTFNLTAGYLMSNNPDLTKDSRKWDLFIGAGANLNLLKDLSLGISYRVAPIKENSLFARDDLVRSTFGGYLAYMF